VNVGKVLGMELYRCDVWGFGGCVERLDRKRYTWALRPNQPSPENVPGPRSPGRSGADDGQGTTTVDSLMPQVIHPGTQGMECRVQGVIQEDRFQCPIPVVVVVGERGFRISLSSTGLASSRVTAQATSLSDSVSHDHDSITPRHASNFPGRKDNPSHAGMLAVLPWPCDEWGSFSHFTVPRRLGFRNFGSPHSRGSGDPAYHRCQRKSLSALPLHSQALAVVPSPPVPSQGWPDGLEGQETTPFPLDSLTYLLSPISPSLQILRCSR
jgi:hypothetical protein